MSLDLSLVSFQLRPQYSAQTYYCALSLLLSTSEFIVHLIKTWRMFDVGSCSFKYLVTFLRLLGSDSPESVSTVLR